MFNKYYCNLFHKETGFKMISHPCFQYLSEAQDNSTEPFSKMFHGTLLIASVFREREGSRERRRMKRRARKREGRAYGTGVRQERGDTLPIPYTESHSPAQPHSDCSLALFEGGLIC